MDISYHGGSFHGWQAQKNARSVQQTIEEAIQQVVGSKTSITGSGRTDTGVHASQQIAHFDLDSVLSIGQLAYKLNAILPKSISINQIHQVSAEAHARFDAEQRRYDYYIHKAKNPFIEGLSHYFHRELDLKAIEEACGIIAFNKDFESFSRVKTEVNHFNCDIFHCQWQETATGYQFTIKANRFLRGMVRALVGTLLDVGLSKLSVADFDLIVRQKDRRAAGAAAPPHGLYLSEVSYPENIYIN